MQEIQGFSLSPQQKRLWHLQQQSLAADAHCVIEITGKLDEGTLRAALGATVRRHQVFRTTFRRMGGVRFPLQIVEEPGEPAWRRSDLEVSGPADLERRIAALFAEEPLAPVAQVSLPVVRARLVSLGGDRHRLLLAVPKLCADAATLALLFEEIAAAYATVPSAGPAEEGEDLQYVQFSEWQNQLVEETDEEAREHWRRQLAAAADGLSLPGEQGDTSALPPSAVPVPWTSDHAARTARLAEELGVPLPAVLLAGWQVLLARLSSRPDFAVWILDDGRKYDELRRVCGAVSKWLPLRSRIDAEASFQEVAVQAAALLAAARDWQEYFTIEGALPVGATAVGFEAFNQPRPVRAGEVEMALGDLSCWTEPFKLKLSCRLSETRSDLSVQFDAGALPLSTAQRIARYFAMVAASCTAYPGAPVGQAEILGQEDLQELLVDFNRTAGPCPAEPLHRLFERQAAVTPEAIAVVCGDRRLTYAELDERAGRLAHRLIGLGAGQRLPVGLFFDPSPEMVVALFAVLKAGSAYLPLDPSHPRQRLAAVLADSGAAIVLASERLAPELPASAGLKVVLLDGDGGLPDQPDQDSERSLEVDIGLDDLAYILYTSGSTGGPKGVMVPHRGVVNYLAWALGAYEVEQGTGAPVHSPLGFDLTVTSLLAPLLAGRTAVLLPPAAGPEALGTALRGASGFSLVKLTPAHLEILRHQLSPAEAAGRARALVVGGEALFYEGLRFWREHAPETRIINEYGPTETVVGCSMHAVSAGAPADGPVPIGRPIANTRLYVLDGRHSPVPVGIVGELYVGGAGVARGYLGRPAQTAAAFVPDSFGGEPGGRLYRTGDLVRHLAEGGLEYVGRADHQLKLRGFRIEPGEIEVALMAHPGVRESLVMMREDELGDRRLVAYMVPDRRRVSMILEEDLYRLPNGLVVAQLNPNEADVIYQEIYHDRMYMRHKVSLSDGACVFDVGANIGLFTLFVHQACRKARVFAFEPIPAACDKLRANVRLYGVEAEVFECGLASRAEVANFTFYPKWSAMSGLYADPGEEEMVARSALTAGGGVWAAMADELVAGRFVTETVACQLRTLSDVIREHGVERIDLLKIDAEKSELDIFRGLRDEDWPKIRQVVVEVHDHEGRLETITGWLRERGFEVEEEQDPALRGTSLYNVFAVRPEARVAPAGESDLRPLAVSETVLALSEIRRSLEGSLPEYMVPSAFVFLDALPLTANGKVDRAALPPPAQRSAQIHRVAPRTDTEKEIAVIWTRVLRLAVVGIDDNFFDLGGHSLLATQVVAQARSRFAVNIALEQFFRAPTIRKLAEEVERELLAGSAGQKLDEMLELLETLDDAEAESLLGPHHA